MTALAARPGPADLPASDPRFAQRDGAERWILGWALAVAALIHLLALLLPLPQRARAVPTPTVRHPIELTPVHLPAPEFDPPDVARPARPTRRVLLPVETIHENDPVAEPRPEASPVPWDAFAVDESLYDADPPPPVGPVDEEAVGLVRPRGVMQPDPQYPPLAVAARREGVVVLRAVITAEGTVESIEVQSAPRPDLGFSDAAVAAVARWRYEPGRLDGRAVAVSMRVVVEFNLR